MIGMRGLPIPKAAIPSMPAHACPEALSIAPASSGQECSLDRRSSRPAKLPIPPTSQSACLASGPAWRTTAVAPDGLCRGPSPPARPDRNGEKLSFFNRNFATSREIRAVEPATRRLDRNAEVREYFRFISEWPGLHAGAEPWS